MRHTWEKAFPGVSGVSDVCKRCSLERRHIKPANPAIFGHPRAQYRCVGGVWSDVYHECREPNQGELFTRSIVAGAMAYHEGYKQVIRREEARKVKADCPKPNPHPKVDHTSLRKKFAVMIAPDEPTDGELVRLTFDPLGKWLGKIDDYRVMVTCPTPLPRGLDVTVRDTFGAVLEGQVYPYMRILKGREGCCIHVAPSGACWKFNRGKWIENEPEETKP